METKNPHDIKNSLPGEPANPRLDWQLGSIHAVSGRSEFFKDPKGKHHQLERDEELVFIGSQREAMINKSNDVNIPFKEWVEVRENGIKRVEGGDLFFDYVDIKFLPNIYAPTYDPSTQTYTDKAGKTVDAMVAMHLLAQAELQDMASGMSSDEFNQHITKAKEFVNTSAQRGELRVGADINDKFDTASAMKLAFMRELAKDMGYETGNATLVENLSNPKGGERRLPIRRKGHETNVAKNEIEEPQELVVDFDKLIAMEDIPLPTSNETHQWTNALGEKITQEQADELIAQTELVDKAKKYNDKKIFDSWLKAQTDHIIKSVANPVIDSIGFIGSNTDSDRDHIQRKVSLIRTLARDIGYKVGRFELTDVNTWGAPISKK